MAAVPDREAAGTVRHPGQAPRNRDGTGSTSPDGGRSLLGVLLALTLLSGLIDGVCYLGLGRVFTANMTGNVVVLGFAAAGAPGFSVTACVTSLGLFLAGAVCGGQVSSRVTRRSRLLVTAVALEAAFVARRQQSPSRRRPWQPAGPATRRSRSWPSRWGSGTRLSGGCRFQT